jgi:ElaB/YqjD/DUF883 family membrane-anchored ribosome-binding protein
MKKRKFAEGGETAEEKLGKYIKVPSEAVGGRFPAVKSKLPAASRAARLAEGKEPRENVMRDYAEAEVLEGDNLRKTAKQNIADERQKISELADQYKRETRGKKAGGTIRSASGRADGIAARGKTRGKIC